VPRNRAAAVHLAYTTSIGIHEDDDDDDDDDDDVIMSNRDLDDVKRMFSDMSIKVLGLTYAISMLHMLFDFLAFKNDIGFFKSRKDFTGLSTRSLATSCCCSFVRDAPPPPPPLLTAVASVAAAGAGGTGPLRNLVLKLNSHAVPLPLLVLPVRTTCESMHY
jgi:hypothetical protein